MGNFFIEKSVGLVSRCPNSKARSGISRSLGRGVSDELFMFINHSLMHFVINMNSLELGK